MTNNDIVKLINLITRKDNRGNPNFVENFNRLLQKANIDQYQDKYTSYQVDQDINDSLSPFEVIEDVSDLTTTTNTITLPDDYASFIAMSWVDDEGKTRVFDLVTDEQWSMRCSSTLSLPTNNHPICKLVGDKLYIKPYLEMGDSGLLVYYGSGAKSLTMSEVTSLSSETMTTGNKTYAYSPTEQVCYVAYPSSYGDLVSILDDNGYEVISDWTLSSGTVNTVDYNIYEFDNLTTQIDFDYTFKF